MFLELLPFALLMNFCTSKMNFWTLLSSNSDVSQLREATNYYETNEARKSRVVNAIL